MPDGNARREVVTDLDTPASGVRLLGEIACRAAAALELAAVGVLVAQGDGMRPLAGWPSGAWPEHAIPAPPVLAVARASSETVAGRLDDGFGECLPAGAPAIARPIAGAEGALFVGISGEREREFTVAERARFDDFAELAAGALAAHADVRRAEAARTRMEGVIDAGMTLAAELELDDLLQRLVEAARQVLGARYAALGVLNAERTALADFITAGVSDEQRAVMGPLPRGHGILGALIRDARPLRLDRMADDARAVGTPPGHPPMESFLGVPVGRGGEVFGNLYLTDKVGGVFSAEDEALARLFAAQAAIAIENARRYRVERERVRELERMQDITRAVQELGQGLFGALDPDHLLALLARRARSLVGAQTAAVALREQDGYVIHHAHGEHALALEALAPAPDPEVLRAQILAAIGPHTVEVVVLAHADEPSGALVVIAALPLDELSAALMQAVASQAVIAIENARRHERQVEDALSAAKREAAEERTRLEALAQRRALEAHEAERARLARELHDETGQVLTAVAVRVRALEADEPDPERRARLEELRGLVRDAAETVRRVLRDLRPAAVREHGLAGAIQAAAARLSEHEVTTDTVLDGIPNDLPDEVQLALFRVAQEALTNIARHARATRASVLGTRHGTKLRLVIEDDGRGFDPEAETSRLGLVGIRERVELLGGSLRIESAPGVGTAVIVDLDLAAERRD